MGNEPRASPLAVGDDEIPATANTDGSVAGFIALAQ